jgi:FkbM family methyltransferase
MTRKAYLKLRIHVLTAIQHFFGLFGLQLRRLNKGTSVEDVESELFRLAGSDVRTIFEFGAADGRDSEALARRFPHARVVAIEPVPQSFKKLSARGSALPNLIAIEAAVGATSGETTLFVSSEADASSIFRPVETGSAFDKHSETVGNVIVRQVTLDEVSAGHDVSTIDILKMDAQGAELQALKGASRLLGKSGIKFILAEIQFIRLYDGACLFHELWGFLETHDFYLHGVYDMSHNEHGQLCWGDAIFVHESVRPQNATQRFPKVVA